MRAKVAKRIRKAAYGKDHSPRARQYARMKESWSIVAIGLRQEYQELKKLYYQNVSGV